METEANGARQDPRIEASRQMLERYNEDLQRCRKHERWAIVEGIGIITASIFAGLVAGMILRGLAK